MSAKPSQISCSTSRVSRYGVLSRQFDPWQPLHCVQSLTCHHAGLARTFLRPLRDQLLHWRPIALPQYTVLQRECRPSAKCSPCIRRDHGEVRRQSSTGNASVLTRMRPLYDDRDVREVGSDTLEPIMFLLQSHDVEVQRAASAALGNLAVNSTYSVSNLVLLSSADFHTAIPAENKLLIVQLGGLEPLIRQMLSTNVEVQCNAVGCITNLATHDENKTKIAKSGALVPLTRLARSKDMRVQRNATGALLNMTHSDENRTQLVNAGAIPVLVSLLSSPDTDVQYYCTTALSNIAVDGKSLH